jgi:hypothetical protein
VRRLAFLVSLLPLLAAACSSSGESEAGSGCAGHGPCRRVFERTAVAIIESRYDVAVTGIRCTVSRSDQLPHCLVRTQPDRCDYWRVQTGRVGGAEVLEPQPVAACRKLRLP